jgi:hypothetical protein
MDRPPGGWSELATNRALSDFDARLDRRFVQLEQSFDVKLGALEDRIDRKLAGLEARIDRAFAVQAWRLVGSMIALGGVLVAAIKF